MTVYLLHFSKPVSKHAKHYLGTTSDLTRRLTEHSQGHGAKLTRAAWQQHIEQWCVRTWEGDYDLERSLKYTDRQTADGRPSRRHSLTRLCPVCNSDALPVPGRKTVKGVRR